MPIAVKKATWKAFWVEGNSQTMSQNQSSMNRKINNLCRKTTENKTLQEIFDEEFKNKKPDTVEYQQNCKNYKQKLAYL